MAWRLTGQYFENCSCEMLCPCITSPTRTATYDRCLVAMVVRIDDGHLDETRLDGLSWAWLIDSPKSMAEGNWRVGTYVDERASAEQRESLLSILEGRQGGVPGALQGVFGERLGTKFVPITFEVHERVRRAQVPGLLDIEVEGQSEPEGEVYLLSNVDHPFGNTLPIARATRGLLADPDLGLSWNNAGKNGHYREFTWAG